MKSIFLLALVLISSLVAPSFAHAEDWKGQSEGGQFSLAGLTGLGIVDSHPGFSVMGAAATKLLSNGFISDVNNSVWLETELGPLFTSGSTVFAYSLHLRWDFVKDSMWTFYALGGLGGFSTPDSLGGHFEMWPRFGVGALWKMFEGFDVRMEVSHELIAVGAQVYF